MSKSVDKAGEQIKVSSDFKLVAEDASDEAAASPAQTNQTWQIVRELLETVVLSLVIFLVTRMGVQNYRIESHSMDPNFAENEFVLVNKLAYRFGEPQHGDVLVFHNPNNPREDYIKRIIGLPGDTLEFIDGRVVVNGEILNEPLIDLPTYGPIGEIVVSAEHLFVMGDNRPNSRDSRNFGQLPMDLVVGKAWVRVWPFNRFGLVTHQVDPGEWAPIRDQ